MVSTRLAGTDGVSLEAAKVATVLERMGHQVFYCAGELDEGLPGIMAPELHFHDPAAIELEMRAFGSSDGSSEDDPGLIDDISHRARQLQEPLRQFVNDFAIDTIIAQNVFAVPMQLPLAQALAEFMRKSSLPGVAHNHDLYWERERFEESRIKEFLDTYFPPKLPLLRHVTINSLAQQSLLERRNIASALVPNVFDFAHPAPGLDNFNADFRTAVGLKPDDLLFLQPTRVVPRKGIELSLELVSRLNDPRIKLVITHEAGDEGMAYLRHLENLAADLGVDMRYVAGIISSSRGVTTDGRKAYSLWDAYVQADFVTYPSLIEGFGNALLETVYFEIPAMVNRYPVYAADISPQGFQFVEIDEAITPRTISDVMVLLDDAEKVREMTRRNFRLGQEHYSYETLEAILRRIGF